MKANCLIFFLTVISIKPAIQAKDKTYEEEDLRYAQEEPYNEEAGYSEHYLNQQKNLALFNFEWQNSMADYESPYVYMIPVAYKSHQVFYENITQVPIRVRGAFILNESPQERIDFSIKAPNGTTIYFNSTHSTIFSFNATDPGVYEVSFMNKYKNAEMKPTFTMSTQQNEILKKEDLNHTEASIDQMIAFLKGIDTEDKMKRNIHKERHLQIVKTNKYFYTFSIVETLMLFAISAWQFYYMRRLLQIKGSL